MEGSEIQIGDIQVLDKVDTLARSIRISSVSGDTETLITERDHVVRV